MIDRLPVFLLLAAVAVPGAFADDPAPPEPDESWRPLFNGRSLSGWEVPTPEYWKVEDGAIHVTSPEGATYRMPRVSGSYKDFNFIRTSRSLPSFHATMEVKMIRGRIGFGHWGTMKKTWDDSFFYGHDDWFELRMTWQGGTVLLFFNDRVYDYSREARQKENVGKIYIYTFPGSEFWIRNLRIETLGNGGRGGRGR